MKRIAPMAVVLAILSAPAFAFSTDISMPYMTFPDSTVSQGTASPATVPAPEQADD
jgi:hypothetical protein